MLCRLATRFTGSEFSVFRYGHGSCNRVSITGTAIPARLPVYRVDQCASALRTLHGIVGRIRATLAPFGYHFRDRHHLFLVLLVTIILTACGPSHVTVPDTRPPLVPPPADARQSCLPDDHAHQGVLPDLETGTRAEVLRAAAETARILSLCHERHQTILDWLDDELEKQRTRPD